MTKRDAQDEQAAEDAATSDEDVTNESETEGVEAAADEADPDEQSAEAAEAADDEDAVEATADEASDEDAVEATADEASDEEAVEATADEASDEDAVEASADGVSEEAPAEGDASADEEPEEELPPLVPVLEAALFASAEAVPLTRLTRVLGAWSRKQVVAGLEELAERQEREGSGIRVMETAGGFQLRSVSDYAPWVRKFFAEKPPRLSRAVLETLAIVAYRQPATRGEVEAVRGVNCDAVLGALTARGLIQVIGRRQSPGRPVEYGTTQEFLELFSLTELEALPPLPDPSSLANLIEEARTEEEAEAEGAEAGASAEPGDDTGEATQEAAPNGDDTQESEPDGISDGQEAAGGDQEEASDDGLGGETPEDPESGGDRIEAFGGSPDPGGAGPSEREGDPRAGSEG